MAELPTADSPGAVERDRLVPMFPAGPAPDPAPVPGTPEAAAQVPVMQKAGDIIDAPPAGLSAPQRRAWLAALGAMRDLDGVVQYRRGQDGDGDTINFPAAWAGKLVYINPDSGNLIIKTGAGQDRYVPEGTRAVVELAAASGVVQVQGTSLRQTRDAVIVWRLGGDVYELPRLQPRVPAPTGEADDAGKVPALNAGGTDYELVAAGDITAVTTDADSGLEGGATSGDADLKLRGITDAETGRVPVKAAAGGIVWTPRGGAVKAGTRIGRWRSLGGRLLLATRTSRRANGNGFSDATYWAIRRPSDSQANYEEVVLGGVASGFSAPFGAYILNIDGTNHSAVVQSTAVTAVGGGHMAVMRINPILLLALGAYYGAGNTLKVWRLAGGSFGARVFRISSATRLSYSTTDLDGAVAAAAPKVGDVLAVESRTSIGATPTDLVDERIMLIRVTGVDASNAGEVILDFTREGGAQFNLEWEVALYRMGALAPGDQGPVHAVGEVLVPGGVLAVATLPAAAAAGRLYAQTGDGAAGTAAPGLYLRTAAAGWISLGRTRKLIGSSNVTVSAADRAYDSTLDMPAVVDDDEQFTVALGEWGGQATGYSGSESFAGRTWNQLQALSQSEEGANALPLIRRLITLWFRRTTTGGGQDQFNLFLAKGRDGRSIFIGSNDNSPDPRPLTIWRN